jgi:hypothetical protein
MNASDREFLVKLPRLSLDAKSEVVRESLHLSQYEERLYKMLDRVDGKFGYMTETNRWLQRALRENESNYEYYVLRAMHSIIDGNICLRYIVDLHIAEAGNRDENREAARQRVRQLITDVAACVRDPIDLRPYPTARHLDAPLPIIADALEDDGCVDRELLAHCRAERHWDACCIRRAIR